MNTSFPPRAKREALQMGYNIHTQKGVLSPYGGNKRGAVYTLIENKPVQVITQPSFYDQSHQSFVLPQGYVFVGSDIVKIQEPIQERLI